MEVSLEDVRHALVTSGSRNSYKLIEGISSGGFGLVVKAKHVPSDEVVAIKFIDCRSGLPCHISQLADSPAGASLHVHRLASSHRPDPAQEPHERKDSGARDTEPPEAAARPRRAVQVLLFSPTLLLHRSGVRAG